MGIIEAHMNTADNEWSLTSYSPFSVWEEVPSIQRRTSKL